MPPKKKNKNPLLLQNKEFLVFLNGLSPEKRKKILVHLKKKQINTISEIFSNFLKRKLTLNKKIIKRASRYKKELRRIALKKTPLGEKIKVLSSQRGGNLLGVLLPTAVSLISSLFSRK